MGSLHHTFGESPYTCFFPHQNPKTPHCLFFYSGKEKKSKTMSETKAVEKIPRPPQIRSLQMSRLPGLMAAALGFATFNTWVYYYFVFDARRKAYRDFYASYDADKAYAEMKKTGIFQSTAIIEGESEEE